MVRHRLLNYYHVKLEDITNAHYIYDHNLAGVRGKTVRIKPYNVEKERIPISRDTYVLHKFFTLTADLMFVNGMDFLTTLRRKKILYTS